MTMRCPNERELSSYLDSALSGAEREKIEAHIASCGKCLDLLVLAHEAGSGSWECPELLKGKIRKMLGVRERRSRSELKWLFGTIIMLALSFVFKRYFLQFLTASLILGFKWAMEGEAARRTIMIFKGMQQAQKKVERKVPSSRV
ncbi:MAG: zf-HC2 domain-containing protein [Candidatus Gorgyraea atricola]|nr:zf-HC2 domain-containing protein [Candidatus Gorgyraea atricola]